MYPLRNEIFGAGGIAKGDIAGKLAGNITRRSLYKRVGRTAADGTRE